MSLAEELALLIKSKYPLVYLESPDEDYALRQLKEIAGRLGLILYSWSLTGGLRREGIQGGYYQTNDPVMMLRTLADLIGTPFCGPALYVLKDFHRHLENDVTVRLFKDILAKAKELPDTLVILAPEFKLPRELEPMAARILGGYPDEAEIDAELEEISAELRRQNGHAQMALAPEDRTRIVRALKGLTAQQIRNIVTRAFLDDERLDLNDLAQIEAYKREAFDQQGFLEFCPAAMPSELAGLINLQAWLSERRTAFAAPAPDLPPPKGVLLMGVQGCGKSLAIKVIAGLLGLPLYRLELGRLYSKFVGETEANLRRALAVAEKLAPLCLWIDEIEKVFAASDGQVDGGVSQRILGEFLTWLQERKAPCFVAATANDVFRLPPEFLRKGRFDEIFFVDLPGAAEREEIIRIHLQKRGLDPARFDLPALAAACAGFNGAEIEQVVVSALYGAAHRKQAPDNGLILERIAATKPLSVMKREEIEALREWARERTVPA